MLRIMADDTMMIMGMLETMAIMIDTQILTMDTTLSIMTDTYITNSPIFSLSSTLDTNNLIIEYSKNPPNKYIMEDATIRYREHNRVCADVIEVFLRIEDGIISEYAFDGYMSIIATACASIIGESIVWISCDMVLTYDESYVKNIIGDGISPRRRNASLIGLLAIKNAIHEYNHDSIREDFSDIFREI